ncbi:MAG: radical SAM protein [Candidatus Methanofastidiosia archaeon]|jgi:radical SAM protein with 4Fe4S-binding SPASM domain
MSDGFPVLKEDIFFARAHTPSPETTIFDTTTQKNFKSTPDTVALLELCTGAHSVEDIIGMLSEQSGESHKGLAGEIRTFLDILEKKGVIQITKDKKKKDTVIKEIYMKNPLDNAQIEITNTCNLSCVHCFNDSGSAHPAELTTEEVLSVIDELSSMGVYQITLTGGEPFVHPDIFRIIEHARKAPMAVDIFTNGTLITEDAVKKLLKYGIRRFNVSLDSIDPSIHDEFRGKKGALQKTLHGISLLQKAGCAVKLVVSLSQYNKDSIIDILKYMKANTITDFNVLAVRYSGRGVTGISVSPHEFFQGLHNIFEYIKEEFPEASTEINERTGVCSIARNSIGIKSDGVILPCPGCDKNMGIGNIRDTSIKEAWETNKKLEQIRGCTAQSDSICSQCEYTRFCKGCIAGAYLAHNTLRCHDPYVCAQTKARNTVFEFLNRNREKIEIK